MTSTQDRQAEMKDARAGDASEMTRASRRRQLLILLCVSVPSFMINLDANIVAVSLPSIARTLHADFAATEWVISAYTLAFASLLLPAGALADRFGRKRLLTIGLAVFTIASLFCGAATTMAMLNAARAVQGAGAALLLSAALATLADAFRGRDRAAAFAFWGTVIGVAMTLGPIAGGIITRRFGWEWAFYVNVPVGLVMMALTARAVRESRDPDAVGIDVAGAATFAGALFSLTLALISVTHLGWSSPIVRGEVIAAMLLAVAFVFIERRQARPMLDFSFFRQPTFLGASLANTCYAAALLTMLTFLPLYFQSGFGAEAETAGLMMLPMVAPLVLVPKFVARVLAPRLSGRALLTLGFVLVALGLLEMGLVAVRYQFGAIVAGMLIAGAGAGILNAEAARVGMSVIPSARAGMAAGIGGTVRFAGLVIGFAALGAVLHAAVSAQVGALQPALSAADRVTLVQQLVSGAPPPPGAAADLSSQALRLAGLGAGYRMLFLSAAALASFAAAACWRLVRASDTAPSLHASPSRALAHLPQE